MWELQMPKAANPFDYRTIADVLFTVEYTAMHSADYRQQVIKQLPDRVSAERPLSLRDQFADEWYALHNPRQTITPLVVTFRTARPISHPTSKSCVSSRCCSPLSGPKGSRSKSRARNCASRHRARVSRLAGPRGVRWMASSAPAVATPGAGRQSSGERPWARGS